ncbi:MAG: hypothetical protein O7H41_20810 [Planctomycetota bacterium]|nr:hypothetical protein [Planctomycetota bacterium]
MSGNDRKGRRSEKKVRLGPMTQENWKAAIECAGKVPSYECRLYSDAHVIGEPEESFGPYQILNALDFPVRGAARTALLFRYEEHLTLDDFYESDPKTDTDRYHGGGLAEEIAALISLILRMRLKAGPEVRRFDPDGDPKGRLMRLSQVGDPVLLPPASWAILPGMAAQRNAGDLALLRTIPQLPADKANALVRAARLYQDAVWVAESQPSLAWVYLVSAVEVVAGAQKKTKWSPTGLLREYEPDLSKRLEESGGEELVEEVAKKVAHLLRSTKKFIEFLIEFKPAAPEKRPPESYRVSWQEEDLRNDLKKVYDWRSKALHDGTPMPPPMCDPALPNGEAFWEKPMGKSVSGRGGLWRTEDTPMLLHIFEHLVRGALLRWWRAQADAGGV